MSNKNVYKSANSLLPAVHKKARPREGHMGVSIPRVDCIRSGATAREVSSGFMASRYPVVIT